MGGPSVAKASGAEERNPTHYLSVTTTPMAVRREDLERGVDRSSDHGLGVTLMDGLEQT